MATNRLYYGDNLIILRDYIPSASVDLIYLDPPYRVGANKYPLRIVMARQLSPRREL